MTSLGRVGTVNACGNSHLTIELLRKEWGFDGMVITDGYGVTSYMYGINDMIGANSGLLCFGNSGNFGECRDYMELYRYYLQYPGRTTAALRNFMKGCMCSLLESHTFRDLYTDYDYYKSEDAAFTTDINWFDAQIGLGYTYHQADRLTYLGIKLREGESNPPSMMPNFNCKDRGGTIRTDDYGLAAVNPSARAGELLTIPVSIQKSYGMSKMGFTISVDKDAFDFAGIHMEGSILSGYDFATEETAQGVNLWFATAGNVFSKPCGKLFDLRLTVKKTAKPGSYPIGLLPMMDEAGNALLLDKQGHEMSFTRTSQTEKYKLGSGWSGVYQDVENAAWQTKAGIDLDDLADVTLLSGSVTVLL